jgi:hypothetical protein
MIGFVGPLLKGEYSRLDLFIVHLVPLLAIPSLGKASAFEGDSFCLYNIISENSDLG